MKPKTFTLKTLWGTYNDITVSSRRYADNDSLAVQLFSLSEGPFATLTVNLDETKNLGENEAFVDINNCPWAPEFIRENDLGEPTDKMAASGFCVYPSYKFNLEKFTYAKEG